MSHNPPLFLDVWIQDGRNIFPVRVVGRQAWALLELIRMGAGGCSSGDNPAPRWSAYIHKLRALGITIETHQEKHDGPFPGYHARYVLKSRVFISNASGFEGVTIAEAP